MNINYLDSLNTFKYNSYDIDDSFSHEEKPDSCPTVKEIEKDPFLIQIVPKDSPIILDLAMAAVKKNGLTIHLLPKELQKDKTIRKISKDNTPQELKSNPYGNRIFFQSEALSSMANHQYFNTIHQVQRFIPSSSAFIRDSQVTLFSGNHLIPYSLNKFLTREYLFATIPKHASFFFINDLNELANKALAGLGHSRENTAESMIMAQNHRLSFMQGTTCIEGGNCYLFKSNGRKMALLGELSLFLSMRALKEQFDFPDVPRNAKDPAEESIRIARNLEYYKQFKNNVKKDHQYHNEENLLKYCQQINRPLSDNERSRYWKTAQKIEVQIETTKNMIADELDVPQENIAIIPQTKFHIDMEMFVTPNGEVVLHDNQMAMDFLNEIEETYEFNPQQSGLISEYYKQSLKENGYSKETQLLRKEILKKHQIPFRCMPLNFRSKVHDSFLNFANGIFVENGKRHMINTQFSQTDFYNEKLDGHSYISTGISYKEEFVVYDKFVKIFQQNFPKINFVGIEKMSKFISDTIGGIHCLTMEENLICDQNLFS